MKGAKSLILALMVVTTIIAGGAGNVAAAGDVTVNITNQNSVAVENADVVITNASDGTQVASGTTGSSGSFTASSLADADYDVEVTSPSGEDTVVKTVTVAGSNVTVGMSVTTVGSAELTLSHVDTSNAMDGVEVEIQDSSGNVVNTKTTDSEGRVLFKNVESGSYTYNIAPSGENYVNKTLTTTVGINATVYNSGTVTPYHTVKFSFYDPNDEPETAGFVDHYDASGNLVNTYYANSEGVAQTKVEYGTEVTFEAADERSEYETASKTVVVEEDLTYDVNFAESSSDATTSIQLNDSSTSTETETGGGTGSPVDGVSTGVLVGGVLFILVILGFAAVRE